MDTKQLKHFLSICDNKSITQAAENLYISQQGLATSIIRLENELKCSLFIRNTKGITLTKEGSYFRLQAEKIIAILNESIKNISQENSKKTDFVLGCAYGVVAEYANDLFESTEETSHVMNVSIKEFPDKLCEAAILDNDIELGLCIGPLDKRRFDCHFLIQRRFCFVVHRSNPLSKFDKIDIGQLRNEKIIMMKPDFKVHNILSSLCKSAGFTPCFSFEAGEIALVHSLVNNKHGIGVSVSFLAKDLNKDEIKVVDLDEKAFLWSVYLVHKKNHTLSKEAQLLKTSLLKHIPLE
ncbi:MAG: LysR family transcriptional regulator [Desulfuromonadales bacterium]|nr:LysR family transcriptional regulator [Desulfuromonadales bacterium]